MTTPTAPDFSDLFSRPPDRYLDVGAGEVAYRRVGEGPDVLFVHGWPFGGATFRRLLPHLAPHLTCHLVDLVGAGDSRFDRSTPIGVDGHIRAVRRILDILELSRVAAVGHDSGGLIARHALATDPRLRALALIDTEQSQGLSRRFRRFLSMRNLPGFEHILAWAVMRRGLRRHPSLLGGCFVDAALLDGEFETLFLAPLRDDPDRRWATGQLLRSFDTGLVDALPALHARIEAPVQLVWGEEDPFFPVEWARSMADTFRDARLEVIPGAKLLVHEERPTEVAQAMLPILLRD